MKLRNPFKRKKQAETTTEEPHVNKKTETARPRPYISEERFLEGTKNIPGTLRGSPQWSSGPGALSQRVREMREQGPSYGSGATPNDSTAQVSHADRQGTRSLKGTERDAYSAPATQRGTSPGTVYSRQQGTIPSSGQTVPKPREKKK